MGDKRSSDYINLGALYGTPKPETGLPRPNPMRGPVFVSHEEQLRRDLEIANTLTVGELGTLPPGGLPVAPKGKYIPPQLAARPEHGQENFENQEDETMKWSQVAAMAAGMAVAQAGCAPTGHEKRVIEYKQNPTPAKAYELRMRIDDAPGTFGSIQGFMQFDVTNTACLPPPEDNPAGYSSPVPYHVIPFELKPVADGEYVATVFADGMINEDYHGYGVCRWRLLNVQVLMKATGAKGETRFYADLFGDELQAEQSKIIYYRKQIFPRNPDSQLAEPISSGQADRSRMASYQDSQLFTIALASKQVTP